MLELSTADRMARIVLGIVGKRHRRRDLALTVVTRIDQDIAISCGLSNCYPQHKRLTL